MLHPNVRAAAEPDIAPLLVFPSLYQRPPSAAQLRQCRQLFYWGFLLLPCLWLLNWWQYRKMAKEARLDDDGVAEMRMYVRWSLVGCTVSAVLLLVSPPLTAHTLSTHSILARSMRWRLSRSCLLSCWRCAVLWSVVAVRVLVLPRAGAVGVQYADL